MSNGSLLFEGIIKQPTSNFPNTIVSPFLTSLHCPGTVLNLSPVPPPAQIPSPSDMRVSLQDMEQVLRCNNLKCRAELRDRALVTTCRYIIHSQLDILVASDPIPAISIALTVQTTPV